MSRVFRAGPDKQGRCEGSNLPAPSSSGAAVILGAANVLLFAAGQHLTDLVITGASTLPGTLKPAGAIMPAPQKVYIDWLLSKEGQTAWSKATGLASLRQDVPTDSVPQGMTPKPGIDYQQTYREQYRLMTDEVNAVLKAVIPAEPSRAQARPRCGGTKARRGGVSVGPWAARITFLGSRNQRL
jgi:hypothetical protein